MLVSVDPFKQSYFEYFRFYNKSIIGHAIPSPQIEIAPQHQKPDRLFPASTNNRPFTRTDFQYL